MKPTDKIIEENSEMDAFKAELSLKDFHVFSDFIYSKFGIKMPEVKRMMLQGRLLKRIRELKMTSYSDYKEYFFSKEGQENELYNFLSVITTNKTDFFREAGHFEFLKDLMGQYNEAGKTVMRVWSSACSSGEELYTIAMVMNEYKETKFPRLNYSILGSDISSNVLEKAARGVYNESTLETVPLAYKKKYFLRNKNRAIKKVCVNPMLKKNIRLQYQNLMDPTYAVKDMYDVIFCRNVLIYFDRETQESVINKLCRHLIKGGYLLIGHSETTANMTVPLEVVKPTIFRRL